MAGMNLETMKLYPPVQFPVAVETPMVSPLLKWDHAQSWPVPQNKDLLAGKNNNTIFRKILGAVKT